MWSPGNMSPTRRDGAADQSRSSLHHVKYCLMVITMSLMSPDWGPTHHPYPEQQAEAQSSLRRQEEPRLEPVIMVRNISVVTIIMVGIMEISSEYIKYFVSMFLCV